MSREIERWPGFLCSTLLVSALASCDPPPQLAFDSVPFVGTIYRSQVFEYHTRDSQPLCPTLLALMDRHAELIGAKLGFSLAPGDPLIPYYRFDNDADFQASGICQPGAAGCADSAVYSPLPFHAHEMAHAYTFRAWGSAPVGLLAEGEAVALSCEPSIWGPSAPSPPLIETPYLADWRPLLPLSGDNLSSLGPPTEEYVAAGVFVTWLATHFGWSAVGQLHQSLPDRATAEEFEQRFAAIFSMSADEAWAAAQGAPAPPSCQPDWQCAGPLLQEGESATADCDLQLHGTLFLGAPPVGLLLFTPIVTVLSCTTPGDDYVLSGNELPILHWARLPPGTYAFATNGSAVDQSVLPLQQTRLSALIGDSCTTAPTFPLSQMLAADSFLDFPPLSPSTIDGWVHLVGGDARHMLGAYGFTGGTITICDGCDENATCAPMSPAMSPFKSQFASIGDSVYVHLAGVSTKNDRAGPSRLDYFEAPAL